MFLHVKAQAQPWIDAHWQPPVYLLRGRRGTTERTEEKREGESTSKEEMIFLIFYTGFVVLEGCLYVCVFLSPLVRTRGEEIVLSTA